MDDERFWFKNEKTRTHACTYTHRHIHTKEKGFTNKNKITIIYRWVSSFQQRTNQKFLIGCLEINRSAWSVRSWNTKAIIGQREVKKCYGNDGVEQDVLMISNTFTENQIKHRDNSWNV